MLKLTNHEGKLINTGVAESNNESHEDVAVIIWRVYLSEVPEYRRNADKHECWLAPPLVRDPTEPQASDHAANKESTLSSRAQPFLVANHIELKR